MSYRQARARRISRGALAVALGVGLVVGGRAWLAAAEVSPSGDCVIGYHADGYSVPVGQGVEVPYENLAGVPYVEAETQDNPQSHAKAVTGYPGFVGDVVGGTAAGPLTPLNPSEADAIYPKAGNLREPSADAHDFGPLGRTEATAAGSYATADAKTAFADLGGGNMVGGEWGHSDVTYTGQDVRGHILAVNYNLNIGPLHIDTMRSEVNWLNDGIAAMPTMTWKVLLHGVALSGQSVTSSSGDGFAFQGGSPQPGPAAHQQSQSQMKQLSDSLDKAGIAEVQVGYAGPTATQGANGTSGTGANLIAQGKIDLDGSGLAFRFAPTARRDNSGQAASLQFGRVILHTQIERGDCSAGRPVQESDKPKLPTGANLPPYPPPPQGYKRPVQPRASTVPGSPLKQSGSMPQAGANGAITVSSGPSALSLGGIGAELQRIIGGALPPSAPADPTPLPPLPGLPISPPPPPPFPMG